MTRANHCDCQLGNTNTLSALSKAENLDGSATQDAFSWIGGWVHVKNGLLWLVPSGGLFPLFSAQFEVMIGPKWEEHERGVPSFRITSTEASRLRTQVT